MNEAGVAIEALAPDHAAAAFDCGSQPLDDWLRRFALVNQAAESARTYVAARGRRIVGFYAIAAGGVAVETAPARVAKGLARHPIPVAILARLAIDRREQGQGLGAALLKDALRRIAAAADILGIRAVLVHAKDEAARRFYAHFGFEPSPLDPRQLFLAMKTLRRALSAGGKA